MKLYLPITVDLYNIYPLSIMNVQQYNIGRGALVTLTAAGQVVVPNKESLYVYAKKKDGTIAYATCTLSGNQIKIDYDEQMTAIVGTMTVELQMVDENGNSITTPIFQVNIQPSNIDYKKVTSSDEFLALVDALNNVNSFQNQIDELNEKLVVSGDVKRIGVFGDDTYKLVLSAQRADSGEPHNTYQLVLDENGGHFGHQSGSDYSFLWWIASTKYVDDKTTTIVYKGQNAFKSNYGTINNDFSVLFTNGKNFSGFVDITITQPNTAWEEFIELVPNLGDMQYSLFSVHGINVKPDELGAYIHKTDGKIWIQLSYSHSTGERIRFSINGITI